MHRFHNDKAKNTETSSNLPHQSDQVLGYAQKFAAYLTCKVSLKWTILCFFFDPSYSFVKETCSMQSNPRLEAADECINFQK